MLLDLLDEQLLVLSITKLYYFYLLLTFLDSRRFSSENLIRIHKPNTSIIVFSELTSHFKNVDVVHLLNIVAHFKTLFYTITVVLAIIY